jgi:succinate dehydrogenase / fumarate reductase cytochrome b subunit
MSTDANRPLSPHLQVYKPQLTSMMSILHRITGASLCVGTLMLAWWLVAAMLGEGAYNTAMNFAKSPLGLFMLFGWSFCLYYHLFNGIRHLIWDTGYLFKIRNAYLAGYMVLALTFVCTAATWYCAYNDNAAERRTENFVNSPQADGVSY